MPARRAALGGPHAGHRAGVEAVEPLRVGGVPGPGEPGADGFDQGVADAVHGLFGGELGRGDSERGGRLEGGDLAGAATQHQGVSGRDPADPFVRRAGAEGLGDVRAGQQRGQVADVEAGLDEVGEREGRGGVGGATGPGVWKTGRAPARSPVTVIRRPIWTTAV